MKDLWTDLVRTGRFGQAAPYQRLAYLCAGLLFLSGLVHIGVYLVDGGPWQGPVSWRKPIVFGLSFAIALATLSWIVGLLRPGKVAGWTVLGVLSVASLGEVFLISMQRWRGVESHFNDDTPFDEMVFSVMGILVTMVGAMIVVVTVWTFIRLDVPAGLALAIRAGLVLMLVSQMVGVQMIAVQGNTFGAAGALKVPHALTSSLVQTYGGRAPLDLGLPSTLLAGAGLALLGTSIVAAVRGLGERLRAPGVVVP